MKSLAHILASIMSLTAASTAFAQSAPAIDLGLRKPHDLSVSAMFLSADIVVKAVMIALALASVTSWTILFAKTFELRRARASLAAHLARLAQARGLAEARLAVGGERGFVGALITGAQRELSLSSDQRETAGVRERIASLCAEIERAQARLMRRGTGVLASIGATAPFVGLFGTVWGIMNAFIGISRAQTTNLAVVAPGIAEALLATAIGLVAAIPAVLIYNHFVRAIAGYLESAAAASGEIQRIVSRDLDRGATAPHAKAGA